MFNEDIAKEVKADFLKRREERRKLEAVWNLNANYVTGNQFSYISSSGSTEEYEKDFYWNKREVYNHIAPIVETRLAKLNNINTSVSVRPASQDRDDVNASKFSVKLLESVWRDKDVAELISKAESIAELTGSAFYKVVWNPDGGDKYRMGNDTVSTGDIDITVCSPYEIFPDELNASGMEDCRSIIYAKAYGVDEIERVYNVKIKGEKVEILKPDTDFTHPNYYFAAPTTGESSKNDYALVLERYTLPTKQYPNGRLEIVAGDTTLYVGDIPYVNGDGQRDLPFVRQVCLDMGGSFFGNTVVERIIPVQRAFNRIKNRKHEYLERIACGVLAVEDGSVDIDDLEYNGLAPGKILTYRQGSTPPVMLDMGKIPSDFNYEENFLMDEFKRISGVSDLMQFSDIPANMTSGVAISLLTEQDNSRLKVTAVSIRAAVKELAKKILFAFKEHASAARLMKIAGELGQTELKCWLKSQIKGSDVVFDTKNEMTETPSARKDMVNELLKTGIFTEKDGSISESNKLKIMEMLGFGNWESAISIKELSLKQAEKENETACRTKTDCNVYDEHEIHISEHTRYLIASSSLTEEEKENMNYHIQSHKLKKQEEEIGL